jgi:hypothetical protein
LKTGIPGNLTEIEKCYNRLNINEFRMELMPVESEKIGVLIKLVGKFRYRVSEKNFNML